MKKNYLLIIFLTFTTFAINAFPRSKQELVLSGSWVYDALMSLSLENGNLNFADDGPLTVNEISIYLNEINYEKLSESGRLVYKKVSDYLVQDLFSYEKSIFSFEIDPEVNLEGYYKTNDKIDWIYDRYDRQEFLTVPAKFQVSDFATMAIDLTLRQNKGTMCKSNNYTNITYSEDTMDNNFPDYGYFSTGYNISENSGFNFNIGLGARNIGRSLTGSIIWSKYFTNSTYANLQFFSPYIRYNMIVDQFNVDKYFYVHQFDVRFFDIFTFSALEGLLVNAPLELRYLNPYTIYHSYAPWRDYSPAEKDSEGHTCEYLGVKASLTPFKNFRIYGLFAMDQLATYYERINWPDDYTPNAISLQFGTEYFLNLNKGKLHAWIEGTYTDPLMYIKQDPNCSLVRTYSENIGNKAVFYEWLGSPNGPDTISAEARLSYEIPDEWNVSLDYLFLAKGQYSGTNVFTQALDWGGQDKTADLSNWIYPNSDYVTKEEGLRRRDLTTPSGTAEFENQISVKATYYIIKGISITGQAGFTFIFNKDNILNNFDTGIEFALSSKINLARIF